MDATFYVYEPSMGYTRVEHQTRGSAEREAERMAILHPGVEFAVLVKLSSCVKREVSWSRINSDAFRDALVEELPF